MLKMCAALRTTLLMAVVVLNSCLSTSAAAAADMVSYYPQAEPGHAGIGFLADGSTLYLGGCRTFDFINRQFSSECRYPKNIRWSKVSLDGTLIFATVTLPKRAHGRSYQLNALTGKILSSHAGLEFAPPLAISPDNKYWIVPVAGRNYEASELLTVVGRDWRVIKRGIYGGVKRVFDLEFSDDHKFLIVNGGGTNGSILNIESWKLVAAPKETCLTYLISCSHDSKFGLRIEKERAMLIRLSDKSTVATIDLDLSSDDSQAAFSLDDHWLAVKGYRIIDKKRSYEFALVRVPE